MRHADRVYEGETLDLSFPVDVNMIALFIIPIVIIVASVMLAVLLRASISISNKILPPSTSHFEETRTEFSPPPSTPTSTPNIAPDDGNPFASPTTSTPRQFEAPGQIVTHAVPQPNFGRALTITLLYTLIGFGINTAFAIALGDSYSLVQIAVGAVVATLLYSKMLPTTAGRALLVYFFQMLIMIAIVVAIVVVVFLMQATS